MPYLGEMQEVQSVKPQVWPYVEIFAYAPFLVWLAVKKAPVTRTESRILIGAAAFATIRHGIAFLSKNSRWQA